MTNSSFVSLTTHYTHTHTHRSGNESSLSAGERSAEEPSVSGAMAGGGEDRSQKWQEEHRDDPHGQGDAGVSLVWHPVGGVHLPGAPPSEEDEECGCTEEV